MSLSTEEIVIYSLLAPVAILIYLFLIAHFCCCEDKTGIVLDWILQRCPWVVGPPDQANVQVRYRAGLEAFQERIARMQARAQAHQVQQMVDPDLQNQRDLPGPDRDDDDPSAAAVAIPAESDSDCESEEMVVCHQHPDPALDEDQLSLPDSGYGGSEPHRRSLTSELSFSRLEFWL